MRKVSRTAESQAPGATSSLGDRQIAPKPELPRGLWQGRPRRSLLRLLPGAPRAPRIASSGRGACAPPARSLPSPATLGKVWRGLPWRRRASPKPRCPEEASRRPPGVPGAVPAGARGLKSGRRWGGGLLCVAQGVTCAQNAAARCAAASASWAAPPSPRRFITAEPFPRLPPAPAFVRLESIAVN